MKKSLRETLARAVTLAVALSAAVPVASWAQAGPNPVPPPSPPAAAPSGKSHKSVITVQEIVALDARFQKELDATKDPFDREAFAEVQQKLTSLGDEIEGTLKRLTTATIPKSNDRLDIDGVMKPATVQNTMDFFYATLVKARRGAEAAGILQNVLAMQKQARDLLDAQKFTEAAEIYRKSAAVLTDGRAKLERSSFQYYSTRADNGQKECNAGYWNKTLGDIQNRYQAAEAAGTPPAEARRAAQAVADEIVRQDYTNPAKYPQMPDDTRVTFRKLLDTANQFLKSH